MLAGGGYVASAWEIGFATGLLDAGVDLRDADLFIGTSSGARVALDLTGGEALEAIYQRRAEPSAGPPTPAAPPAIDWAAISTSVEAAKQAGGTPAEILQRYGTLALATAPAAAADRRSIVAAQLSAQEWPQQRVLITAVNAETGERRVFDRNSGIDVVDAIIATTASFGAAPLRFDGQLYIDGGYHSSDNADLALGYGRVLVLALRSPPHAMRLISIDEGVAALAASGALVEVVHPDDGTMSALAPTGGQMNPASGPPAAKAGRQQGKRAAASLARFWRPIG